MKKNYITLVYLSQDDETAQYLAEILEESKKVEVHKFEKGEDPESAIISDIKESSGLVILHVSDDFDYSDYLPEIKKAKNVCQIICCYASKSVYQSTYPLNEIELVEGYPVEALANDICQIVAGGYRAGVHWYNKGKKRALAFKYFDDGSYVWALGILIKLFQLDDADIKSRIAESYAHLMDADKAINYYSICLPMNDDNMVLNDEEDKGVIYNNLGYLYTQTKNLEFAERYLKLAIEFKNPDALFNLGYLYESCWSYDSSKRRTKEGYDIYCQVLAQRYTSTTSKAKAKEKLQKAADRLLMRKNYAAALQYYKAIDDGIKAAECIRNIKRIRQLYEERKKHQQAAQAAAAKKVDNGPAATPTKKVVKPAVAPAKAKKVE